jgi:glycosyltransferase involved in cell wall biosynthesis
MQTNPLVSVILPVYNTEKYIQESLHSILNQTYSPIEIICCDDGSTDSSYEVLNSFSKNYPKIIKLISNETNSGIATSRNHRYKTHQEPFLHLWMLTIFGNLQK